MKALTKLVIASVIMIGVIITTYTNITLSLPEYTKSNTKILRIGYFPNINHAQIIIGLAKGDFQKALDGIEIKTKIFNAGPSAMEALFANEIDMAYVGPTPTINAYIRSNGEILRIVSGASSGGAVFVVRNDANINSINDFAGKTFASPQLGNTQDVALRAYLLHHNYKTIENGGNVTIKPVKITDMFTLMMKKEIDGAWVPEHWGAKLVREANARIFIDERDLWPEGKFVTAHIIVNTKFLKEHPDIVEKLIKAHVDETNWINNNPTEARKILNEQMERLTGQKINEEDMINALSRIELTYDPVSSSLIKYAEDTYELGFLDIKPDLSNIYDLTILNNILSERGLNTIEVTND